MLLFKDSNTHITAFGHIFDRLGGSEFGAIGIVFAEIN